jgi:hypothetical protein
VRGFFQGLDVSHPNLTGKSGRMPSMLTAVTVSDLLHQLGDIPPEGVRLQAPPGTATEADVVAVHSHEEHLGELVDGVLVEKTLGYYESYIAATLRRLLGNFVGI